jgi:uncharacterized protein (DUF2345 family)
MMQLGTKKQELRLGADRFDIKLIAGTPATIQSGPAKIDISQSGDITLEAVNITIKAQGKLDMQAMGSATLKAEGTVDVEAMGAATLKGEGSTTVTAGGPVTVKGNPVAIN